MNIVKAGAAVNYYEAQLAAAIDAASRAEQKVRDAEAAVEDAKKAHTYALDAVSKLTDELAAAHETLAECESELGLPTGEAGGSAFNPTIRIDPN